MNGPKQPHPDETPITSKIIADADACPETRVVFLIKHLANQCKDFERQLAEAKLDLASTTRKVAGSWGEYYRQAADRVRADQAGAPITLKGAGEAITYIALMNMVDRFLAWPLPDSVRSDTCVTMVGGDLYRSGTNLLTADEARQMLAYVVYGK